MSNALELSNVRDFLKKVNLLEYYDRFVDEGFDDLASIMEVTEADLEAMDVKRGHRRRLQREIANVKGYSHITSLSSIVSTDSLASNPAFSNDNPQMQNIPIQSKPLYVKETSLNNQIQNISFPNRQESQDSDPPPKPPEQLEPTSNKRKYRRHPKRDRHAPVKPASAYVMFAHRVREQYQGQNLSFPEMAKIVGERWKNIPSTEKEAIEKDAAAAKAKYLTELEVYKNSDAWKQYQIYLRQFYDNDNGKPDRDRKKAHTLRFKSERFPSPEHSTSSFPATATASPQATSINYQSNISNNECKVLNNRSNSIFSYQPANCNQHKECTNFHPDCSQNGRGKDSSNNINANAGTTTPTSDSTISSNGSASTTITTATTSTTSTTSTVASMFQSRRTNDGRGN